MSKTAKAVTLLVAVFSLLLIPVSSFGDPEDVEDDYSDAALNQKFDWVVTVDASTLKNFLNYPGSGLHPVDRVKVQYRLTQRFGRERSSYDPVPYEELWYHECKPIGCRKTHIFDVEAGQQGVVQIRTTRDMSSAHCAIANVIVRLLLDAMLKRAMMSAVIVPDEVFDLVQSDLGQFGFYPQQIRPDTGIAATMHLFLQSQPSSREVSLYYFKGQN